jgi:hypothetical protein
MSTRCQSKAKKGLPNSTNGRNHALTITAMADEIAYLRVVASKMDDADMRQRTHVKQVCESGQRMIPFEAIRGEADDRARALEELILTCEPDSLDDALSLALITIGELHGVVDKDGEVKAAFTAIAALARWMIRAGATTPLHPAYYACGYLKPRAQEIEEALVRADELAKSTAINA